MNNVQMTSQKHPPDWDDLSQYQGLRLWRSVLVTLGVDPTLEAKKLFLEDVTAAKDYKKRMSGMRNALSEHDLPGKVRLLSKDHNNGDSVINKMVSLRSVVAFAKARRWSIPDEMHRLWGAPTENVPQRASAEENKNTALRKILAADVFSYKEKNKTLDFKGVVSLLQKKLRIAGVELDRDTLNDHVEAAVKSQLNHHPDVQKQLIRPRNEKHS